MDLFTEQVGSLDHPAQQESHEHDDQADAPQYAGRGLTEFGEPAAHGIGKGDIGQAFKDTDHADKEKKQFHGRFLPEPEREFK